MTAVYSWRLLIMTFYGTARADERTMAHVPESPKSMTVPLIVLAIGAMFSGMLGYRYFVGDGLEEFWGDSIFVLPGHDALENAHHSPLWVIALPVAVAVVGIALVAIGTSLPELATSVAAGRRGQIQIVAGNVIGSNLFNVVGRLGISAAVMPVAMEPSLPTAEVPGVVLLTLLAGVFMLTGRRVARVEGAVLLAAYAGYLIFVVL